jgi:hypothetical protein
MVCVVSWSRSALRFSPCKEHADGNTVIGSQVRWRLGSGRIVLPVILVWPMPQLVLALQHCGFVQTYMHSITIHVFPPQSTDGSVCNDSGNLSQLVFLCCVHTVTVTTAEADPNKRVVITGMGVASVFGNDVDTFYNRWVPQRIAKKCYVGLPQL